MLVELPEIKFFLIRCLPELSQSTYVPYCQALSFLLSIISIIDQSITIIDRGFIALSKTTLALISSLAFQPPQYDVIFTHSSLEELH
jgi:hypothetical protein